MAYQRHTVTTEEQETEQTARLHGDMSAAESGYTRRTIFDPYGDRRLALYRWTQAFYLVFGVLEVLIAMRFVLRLLGANPAAPFAAFVYGATDPFVAPFVGVFGTPSFSGGSVLEPHSLLALAIYALLAWLAVQLLWVLYGETRTGVTSSTVHHHDS